MTSFEEYHEEFKEDLKRQVLEILEPWTYNQKVKIIRYYMDHLPKGREIYWWNREVFFYTFKNNRLLFTDAVASGKGELDWAANTVTSANQIGKILEHPETMIKEVMEE